MKHLLFLFIIVVNFLLQSCSGCKNTNIPAPDNPYGLPNATQTGANIFACRINGQNFIAYYGPPYCTGASLINDTLNICGQPKIKNYFESLGLQIKGNIKIGKYILNSDNIFATYLTDSTCLGIMFNVAQVRAVYGSINLSKIDLSQKIVSGLFNCTIPISNCDSLKVTDGRFDIKYQ
ncbi:MAG: hypothetical protein EO766_16095 [Hydrotalea sp. AMD]|uniref:hypothetical protein n=1 Tax=Hydrotalea sp. AMD TaxID=2501297 RepID=UPI0009439F0E|nr:hypothetical protein [Hydrotalea sp. AMD]RWZ85749.1 MAG: hypothetical protein EO766_16095 [Hydrotalea sp. AMD]